jgi:hypothetical protein
MPKTHSIDDAARRFILANHEPFDWPTRPRRKRRRLSLARAIRHAREAGGELAVAPDGTITLRFEAGSAPLAPANEWDTVQ